MIGAGESTPSVPLTPLTRTARVFHSTAAAAATTTTACTAAAVTNSSFGSKVEWVIRALLRVCGMHEREKHFSIHQAGP
jgi:hypothetical protein